MRIILIAILTLSSCIRGNQPAQTAPAPAARCTGDYIAAFGDSHTSGGFKDAAGNPSPGWVTYLAADLGYCLENYAQRASTLEHFRPQAPVIAAQSRAGAKVSVLMPGFNESSDVGHTPADLASYKAILKTSIQILAANSQVVVIGTQPPAPYFPAVQVGEPFYTQATRESVQELALPNVVLVDVNADFNPAPSDMAPDSCHFSEQGQRSISDLFKVVL